MISVALLVDVITIKRVYRHPKVIQTFKPKNIATNTNNLETHQKAGGTANVQQSRRCQFLQACRKDEDLRVCTFRGLQGLSLQGGGLQGREIRTMHQ